MTISAGMYDRTSYSHLPFEQLIEEEKRMCADLHSIFTQKRVDRCFSYISPLQTEAVLKRLQSLCGVWEELEKRRGQLKSTFLGIPYKVHMIGVKILTQAAFWTATALDFTSLFLDCAKAEFVEFASITCATSAVALTMLDEWAVRNYQDYKRQRARIENCSVERLPGIGRLNDFLESFVELVSFLQNHQKGVRQKTDGINVMDHQPGDEREVQETLSSRIGSMSVKAVGKVQSMVSREKSIEELVRTCLLRLHAVPNSELETLTGGEGEKIKKIWSIEIAKTASIRYEQGKIPNDLHCRHETDSVTVDMSSIDQQNDLSNMSLSNLVQRYREEIARFYREFKIDTYLSSFAIADGSDADATEEVNQQRIMVDRFIATLKTLQEKIQKARAANERSHCFPCIPSERKIQIVNFIKGVSTVVFFGTTSMMGVLHCEDGVFGIRRIFKVVGIVSGVASSIFEGISSFITARDARHKAEMATLINMEVDDLEGINALNVYVEKFLAFVDQIGVIQILKENEKRAPKTNEDVVDINGEDCLANFGGSTKLISAASLLKTLLDACIDALEAIDTRFLEKLIKSKNGELIKLEWKEALEGVFNKMTEGICEKHLGKLKAKSALTRALSDDMYPSLMTARKGMASRSFMEVAQSSPHESSRMLALQTLATLASTANTEILEMYDEISATSSSSTSQQDETGVIYERDLQQEIEEAPPKLQKKRQICILQ